MDENYEDKEVLVVEKPQDDLYREPDMATDPIDITDEMREYSQTRTAEHIERVKTLGMKLGFDFSDHDHSKFSDELRDAYILIDNSYRKDLDPPVPYNQLMAEASYNHIKQEHHHPEYWDPITMINIDFGQNDPDVAVVVNATDMSVPALCEMVCDWCAMSQEVGGHPAEWAQENIGKKWIFTDEQEEIIFALIRLLWNTPDADEAELEAREAVRRVVANDNPDLSWKLTSEVHNGLSNNV